jgi:hypothetical protein
MESKIHGENLQINRHIYISENNRLQDKILVLMSELDLMNKKTEILEEVPPFNHPLSPPYLTNLIKPRNLKRRTPKY